MFDPAIEPIVWSSPADARAVRDHVERDGFCLVRIAGAVHLAQRAPEQLVAMVSGTTAYAAHVAGSDADAADDARLRIAPHPLLPPSLQIVACARESHDAAATVLVDTWRVLADLDARGNSLFDRLFDVHRVVRFHDFTWCAPTFSLRAGNLVCAHHGSPREWDRVGMELQRQLERTRRIRVRLAADDVLVINNHRVVHGRIGRTDAVRVAAWLGEPLPAPAPYVAIATRVALRTEARAQAQPSWIRKRLGFSGKLEGRYDREDLLAYYRGELVESPAAQAQLARAYREATGTRARLALPPRSP